MKARVTMRAALEDANLLGQAMPGKSWDGWKSLLIANEGEPLTDTELQLFKKLTGGREPPTEPCQTFVPVVGRRGGKSHTLGVYIAYISCLMDFEDKIVPGEVPTVLLMAPVTSQAKIALKYCLAILKESPELSKMVEGYTQESITLTNGVEIVAKPPSWRRLRGYSVILACMDEMAFWHSDELSANPDSQVLTAVEPMLLSTRGRLMIASSPYSRQGVLWDFYSKHYGVDHPNVLVCQGGTMDFNPSLDRDWVQKKIDQDPESGAAEYLAQFRTDISNFVDAEALAICVGEEREKPPRFGKRYTTYVDPSGGSQDSMTMAIAHMEGDRAVLDMVREWRPPFSPGDVVREIATNMRSYRCRTCYGDGYGKAWVSEPFREAGMRYVETKKSTSEIYTEFLGMVNSSTVVLLDDKRGINQILQLERRTKFGSNRDTIGHPRNAHDDVANSIAGACVHAKSGIGAKGDRSDPFGSDVRARQIRNIREDPRGRRGPGLPNSRY